MASFDIDGDDDSTDPRHTDATKMNDNMMKGFDDKTFTNAGIQLGMGAFTFGASFATRDDGGYVSRCYATAAIDAIAEAAATETTARVAGVDAAAEGDMIDCARTNAVFEDDMQLSGDGTEEDNSGSTTNAMHKFVEDESMQSDTWAVGITYSDGPMSVSVDHVSHERENGDERTASGVSAGYKLAPGVDWKTSIIGVEDDTTGAAGTIFVTGLDIHF